MNTPPPLTLFRGANIKLDGLIHKSSIAASPHEGFEIRTPAKPSRWLGFLSKFPQFSFGIRARNEIARLQRVKFGDDASFKPVSVLNGLRSALIASLKDERAVDTLLAAATKLAGRKGSVVAKALEIHDSYRSYHSTQGIEARWNTYVSRGRLGASLALQGVVLDGPQEARTSFIKAQALSLLESTGSIDRAAQAAIGAYKSAIDRAEVTGFVRQAMGNWTARNSDVVGTALGADIAEQYRGWPVSEGLLLDALFAASSRNGLFPRPDHVADLAADALESNAS